MRPRPTRAQANNAALRGGGASGAGRDFLLLPTPAELYKTDRARLVASRGIVHVR